MPIPTLPTSRPSTTFLSTPTSGSSTLFGTPGDDQLTANNKATLNGGAGDDIYYTLKAASWYQTTNTKVVELADAGIDSVYSASSFILPANVENLYLTTLSTYSPRFATGNAGDNILSSGAGGDFLTTGGGNDVLFGNGGVDTFGFTKAPNTTSWIADFEAGVDRLNLTNLGFTSFAQVLAASSQVGPDLQISLGGGQTLMIANATAASLDAAHVLVDTPSLATGAFRRLTFHDEFDGALSLNTGTPATAGGTWKTMFHQGDRRLYGNHDEQIYVDPDFAGKDGTVLGLNPFVIDNGILHIVPRPTDPAILANLWNVPFTSGMLSSETSFSQQYGYFEIRAQDSSGKGFFPAFWLLPTDKSWPPEIDVYEQVGNTPDRVSQGVIAGGAPTQTNVTMTGVDMTKAFHTYAMEWTAQKITWFIDGVQTFQTDTPDVHKPMYLIVTLAVGGDWPGRPPADTDWSKADLQIDYIRAYSLDANAPPVGLGVTISNATDATDLSDSFALPLGVAGTSTTFTGAQMQIVGVPNSATVTAAYAANGDLTVTQNAAWNVIKNVTITDTDLAGHGVSVNNFVDVELAFDGGSDDRVDITGIKRGLISTGGGQDTITIAGNSNSSSGNDTVVLAGNGDDVVSFTGNKYNRAVVDGGAGNDQLTVLGQLIGSVTGGAGNDVLTDRSTGAVTLNGNAGADTFAFAAGVRATVGDFAAGVDQIQLIGVAPAGVSSVFSGADTVVNIGGGASIKLLGVHLTLAQLDIHYV